MLVFYEIEHSSLDSYQLMMNSKITGVLSLLHAQSLTDSNSSQKKNSEHQTLAVYEGFEYWFTDYLLVRE